MAATGKMSGETDLLTLLRTMQPVLKADEYAILTTNLTPREAVELQPLGIFQEEEGLTVITRFPLPAVLSGEDIPRFRCITLTVHSSLEAVGFLAAVANRLADHDISVNAVAGYYHDHLFVPADRAEEALELLEAMTDH